MILLKVILQKLTIITTEVKTGLFLQQWIEFNVKKAVVKILQDSVVTQTALGGLTTYSRVANFLQCTHAKNYDNWLPADKVIAKIMRLTFLAHPVYQMTHCQRCYFCFALGDFTMENLWSSSDPLVDWEGDIPFTPPHSTSLYAFGVLILGAFGSSASCNDANYFKNMQHFLHIDNSSVGCKVEEGSISFLASTNAGFSRNCKIKESTLLWL